MNTKLTLTIEDAVIKKAKKYAAEQERSLSDIIENYLKVITSREKKEESEYPPIVKSLKGSFKASKNLDYKKELAKTLSDKYL
jgi:predicted CopG family antitoxin